ncbi:hypothetical protein BTZ20_0765 [Rhodococcus sp. MTM3W5.2]|uniref:hypothetical protein n=1 Tax=Rhodococcus sp. MTM3W5.2 TaxID=1805827 RepID=UPI0009791460|nr:hypothetical protein [Rhodococcus sp. MTM3W5.2]AQA25795.1 hypothetical protein BTZ20_0765 [Rhodococcus sp. MTM3W5.2]
MQVASVRASSGQSIIARPFGTNDIYCASYKSTICYQLDPAGSRHDLTTLNAYIPRRWVLNPVQS